VVFSSIRAEPAVLEHADNALIIPRVLVFFPLHTPPLALRARVRHVVRMSVSISNIPVSPREGEPAVAARESLDTLELLAQRRSSKVMHLAEPAPSSAEIDADSLAARARPRQARALALRGVRGRHATYRQALAQVIANDENVDQARLDHAQPDRPRPGA
jgi:hypothetical protein